LIASARSAKRRGGETSKAEKKVGREFATSMVREARCTVSLLLGPIGKRGVHSGMRGKKRGSTFDIGG